MQRPLGELVDSLGAMGDLEDGDLVTDVVVLGKIVGETGEVKVLIGSSESCSWLEQLALITAASQIVEQGYTTDDEI